MNVYVVRHGQTDYNLAGIFQGRLDIELNEEGKRQAAKTSELLKGIDFDLVITSPLKRTIQTTKIITDKEYKVDERIIERNFGFLEGKKFTHDYEEYVETYGIETQESMRERITEFLEDLKKLKYENVLVVAHGAVAQTVNKYFNCDVDLKSFRLGNAEYIKYTL